MQLPPFPISLCPWCYPPRWCRWVLKNNVVTFWEQQITTRVIVFIQPRIWFLPFWSCLFCVTEVGKGQVCNLIVWFCNVFGIARWKPLVTAKHNTWKHGLAVKRNKLFKQRGTFGQDNKCCNISNNNVSYHKMVRLLAHEIKCWYPSADLLLSHPAVLLSLDNSHNNADMTEVPSFDLNSEWDLHFCVQGSADGYRHLISWTRSPKYWHNFYGKKIMLKRMELFWRIVVYSGSKKLGVEMEHFKS